MPGEAEWSNGSRLINENWRNDAKCSNDARIQEFIRTPEGSDFFHSKVFKDAAKAYCRGSFDSNPCPVIYECRAHSMAYPESGVWGGQSQNNRSRQRNALERQLQQFQERYLAQSPDVDNPNVA